MNSKCNRCGRPGGRNSSYVRKADRKKVIQFRCYRCNRTWTPATDNPEKHQRLRSVNETLRRLLVSGVTMERAAKILRINPKTVARRIPYFAQIADQELKRSAEGASPVDEVYLDELITYEHTRCKPVAVFMVVSKKREILGFRVSSMPAIGKHLKKIALKKYGKRANHRISGIEACLRELKPRLKNPRFKSDEEPAYCRATAQIYPGAPHDQYPSKRAVIAGQGELKDRTYDPIFPINHTFAMLRANLARLIRRTWSTTKKINCLRNFIAIYAHAHNTLFIAQTAQAS